jgi:hypothetical protein
MAVVGLGQPFVLIGCVGFLCSVGNENGTASDPYHTKPIRQRKPLDQEEHCKNRHEDDAELIHRSIARGISQLQSAEAANPGGAVAAPEVLRRAKDSS